MPDHPANPPPSSSWEAEHFGRCEFTGAKGTLVHP